MFKIDFLWSKVLKPKKGRYFNLWPQVKKVFQVINTNYEIDFCDLTWMNLINKHRTQDSLNVETCKQFATWLPNFQILPTCKICWVLFIELFRIHLLIFKNHSDVWFPRSSTCGSLATSIKPHSVNCTFYRFANFVNLLIS